MNVTRYIRNTRGNLFTYTKVLKYRSQDFLNINLTNNAPKRWPQVTASSPVDRTGRLTTPGQTTLGSLLRWSFPDGQVAWADGDDAAHVEGQLGAPVGDIATPPAAVGAPAPAPDKPEGRRRRRS